ncbi:MAG: hypothetical protein QME68_03060 [Elusimicrobiota bacterium]|nr:hypothetical protein [Elusimicrobiota bacterium]
MTEDDIVEIVTETLKKSQEEAMSNTKQKPLYSGFYPKEKFIVSFTSLPKGRPLLTEYELKQKIKSGVKEIHIAKNTIISPLAEEIIQEKGIKVIRE